jgi:hypothetical protein
MKIYSDSDNSFDLGIFALGYESRARYFLETEAITFSRGVAFGYTFYNDLSYSANKKCFELASLNIFEVDDQDLLNILPSALKITESEEPVSVILDISSMSRHRITCILWYLFEKLPKNSRVKVVYSQSKYLAPPNSCPPVKYIGPSIDNLAGVLGDLDMPTACVISLGYEENKALGAVNSIDPAEIWALIPESQEKGFEDKVVENNDSLLKGIPASRRIKVNIHDPLVLHRDLRSLLQGCMRSQRPILLPLGPKIFAAISVILAYEFFPNLPVWRVSSYEKELPVDRKANGKIIGFSILV